MKKVLFVCLGNICRSPMAEAVLRKVITREGLSNEIEVSSAAISRWEVGNPPHEGTRRILDEHHISYKGIHATQVTQYDFLTYDYLIGMDHENVSDLKIMAPQKAQKKIYLFLSVVPKLSNQEVPDPYYTGNFEQTYELVQKGCNSWMIKLAKK